MVFRMAFKNVKSVVLSWNKLMSPKTDKQISTEHLLGVVNCEEKVGYKKENNKNTKEA